MRKIRDIVQEVNNINVKLMTQELKKREITMLRKRRDFLIMCRMYLETNPSQSFIESEKERLINKLNLIEKGFNHNDEAYISYTLKEMKEVKKMYNTIMSVDKIRTQLQTIQFLLHDSSKQNKNNK